MAQIMVTSGTLRSKKAELQKLNSQLKAATEDMTSTVNSLKSSWSGEANDAFQANFNKDKGQMEKFYAEIQKYCTQLDEIIQTYEAAEKMNTTIAKTNS